MKEGQIVKITETRFNGFDFLKGMIGCIIDIYSGKNWADERVVLVYFTSRNGGPGEGSIELVFAEGELALATNRESLLYYIHGSEALLNE